ncbi:MAG: hypothetical protein ACM3S1_09720, partial [Hyphomicrobiales bacterium]
EQLPDEDDEFANMVNADEFPTLDALRQRIRDDLQKTLQENADAKFQNEAIEKLVAGATLEYPRVLVDREIDHIVSETTGSDRQGYLAYLQRIGRSEQEFREQFRESAEERVRRSLAISQLAVDENIEVTDADVEAELDRLSAPLGEEAERFKQLFATPDGVATIRRNLVSQKTLARLSAIASGEAGDSTVSEKPEPETGPAEAEEEPA